MKDLVDRLQDMVNFGPPMSSSLFEEAMIEIESLRTKVNRLETKSIERKEVINAAYGRFVKGGPL